MEHFCSFVIMINTILLYLAGRGQETVCRPQGKIEGGPLKNGFCEPFFIGDANSSK
jgi:hypothetical protein